VRIWSISALTLSVVLLAPAIGRAEAPAELDLNAPEVTMVGALAGGLAIAMTSASAPASASWRGGLLFDDAARGLLRVDSAGGRKAAGRISDVLALSLIAYPVAADAVVAKGLLGRDVAGATHMIMDDVAAFAAAGLAVNLLKNLTSRERPAQRACATCAESEPNVSFPSGHTAVAFTGAALVCSQHKERALYGGGGADDTACVTSLALAGVTGLLRISADRHYMTDVLAGSAIGLASGYLVPRLIHHIFGSGSSAERASSGPQLMAAPQIGARSIGLSFTIF
jgi:membrane-associated phospholipid phosphatase